MKCNESVSCSECRYYRPYCYNAQINDWLLVCVKAKKQPVIIGESMTISFTSNHNTACEKQPARKEMTAWESPRARSVLWR